MPRIPKLLTGVLLCSAGFGPLALAARPSDTPDIRPGLWEFSSRIGLPGAPELSIPLAGVQQRLGLLPPDARRVIEAEMAARGVRLGEDGSARSCITQAQARSANIYSGKTEGSCQLGQVQKSAGEVRGTVSCTDPEGTGEFVARLDGPTRFTTRLDLRSARGSLAIDTEARWLSDDCGAAPAALR